MNNSNRAILAARSDEAKEGIHFAANEAEKLFAFRMRQVFENATFSEREILKAAMTRGKYLEAREYLIDNYPDLGPSLLLIEKLKAQEVDSYVGRGQWRSVDKILTVKPLRNRLTFNASELLLIAYLPERLDDVERLARTNRWVDVENLLAPLADSHFRSEIGSVVDLIRYDKVIEAASAGRKGEVWAILDGASPNSYRLIVSDLVEFDGFERPADEIASENRFRSLLQSSSQSVRRMVMSLGPDGLAVIDEAIATAPEGSSGYSEALFAIKSMKAPRANFFSAELARAMLDTQVRDPGIDLS